MKRIDSIQPLDIVETQTNWDNLKHAEIINMEMVQVAIIDREVKLLPYFWFYLSQNCHRSN